MKKSQITKLVLGLFGAITMALSFSGCAELANTFVGEPGSLKVQANYDCRNRTVDVYLMAVKDGETEPVNNVKYCEFNGLKNGDVKDISKSLPNNTLAGQQYLVYARYRDTFGNEAFRKIRYVEPNSSSSEVKYASPVGGSFDVIIHMYSNDEIRWYTVYNPKS